MKRLGVLAMDQEDIAIISIIMYIQGFYENFEEQMNFLAINYHTSDFMSEFKKKKQRLVSLCGCENDWKELLSNEEGTSLYNLLNMRTVVLNKYMMANGIIVDGQEEAIIKIIKFLFDFKLNDGERDFWKGQIDFDEVVNKKLTDENIIRRDAWCYGNPGICYAIVSAGNALDNQFLIDYGIENLRLTMNNIKGIFSPTFCHGYAGLYQVLNSVEMLLQKEFFSLEKELLKNKITDFYNPDYIYGFKNMELDNKMEKIKPYDVCGLLEGTTGVCLSLLEGEKKSDNLWKKAFLLA